jgi:hypothetical protein
MGVGSAPTLGVGWAIQGTVCWYLKYIAKMWNISALENYVNEVGKKKKKFSRLFRNFRKIFQPC